MLYAVVATTCKLATGLLVDNGASRGNMLSGDAPNVMNTASTIADMYSAITAAIGALRGPKHGGANEEAFRTQSRYNSPDEAEADIRERVAAGTPITDLAPESVIAYIREHGLYRGGEM